MTMFRKVADRAELWSGEAVGLVIDGARVLLVNVDDRIYAYEDRCAHQGVPLSEGRLAGGVLTCRAHHWEYDACTGHGLNPRGVSLRSLAVRVEGDSILVDI
jgi:toluene monooxygenase system ferredoxin subunit